MAGTVRYQTYNGTITSSSGNLYTSPFLVDGTGNSTETNRSQKVREEHIFSNLGGTASTNTLNGATTITFRNNLAAGNQVATIPSSTTGTFVDYNAIDIVASGSDVAINFSEAATSGTSSMFQHVTAQARSLDGIVQYHGGTPGSLSGGGSGFTYYVGPRQSALMTSEANTNKTYVDAAGTFTHLTFEAFSNTLNQATNYTLRKNSADATMTVSVPASTSGEYVDTTNTDSFASGDIITFKITSTATTGTCAFSRHTRFLSSTWETFDSYHHQSLQWVVSDSTTTNYTRADTYYFTTTAANSFPTESPTTYRNFRVNVETNTLTTVTTSAGFCVNDTLVNPQVSIAAAATGIFSDLTNSTTTAYGDVLATKFSKPSAETGRLEVRWVSIAQVYPYPIVSGFSTGLGSGTSTTVTVGGGTSGTAVSGDLFIVLIMKDGTGSFTWPASPAWSTINGLPQNAGGGTNTAVLDGRYLIASGGETTISITHANEITAWHSFRITNWHGSTAVAGAGTNGNSTNPDPPSLDPADWGSEYTLWLAVAGNDGTAAITDPPTNMSTFLNTLDGAAGGCGIATARSTSTATSLDPGVFTMATEQWGAATLAVRPYTAPPPGGTATHFLLVFGVGG